MLRSIPEAGQRLDRMLIGGRDQLHAGLQEAEGNLQKMKELLDKMTAPPWHTGIYSLPRCGWQRRNGRGTPRDGLSRRRPPRGLPGRRYRRGLLDLGRRSVPQQ